MKIDESDVYNYEWFNMQNHEKRHSSIFKSEITFSPLEYYCYWWFEPFKQTQDIENNEKPPAQFLGWCHFISIFNFQMPLIHKINFKTIFCSSKQRLASYFPFVQNDFLKGFRCTLKVDIADLYFTTTRQSPKCHGSW